MKLFIVVKKVSSAIVGALKNFVAHSTVGIRQIPRLTANIGQAAAGVSARTVGRLLVVRQVGAVAQSVGAAGSSVTESPMALKATSVGAGAAAVPVETSGVTVEQMTFGLVRHVGADTIFAVGDWQNPTNAEGKQDGTVATLSSGSLNSASGVVTGGLPPNIGKTDLIIDRVEVRMWFRWQVALLIAGSCTITVDGQTLFDESRGTAQSADSNHLATPLVADITTAVAGNWANLPTEWTVDASHNAGAGTNQTQVDAIELYIEAHREET